MSLAETLRLDNTIASLMPTISALVLDLPLSLQQSRSLGVGAEVRFAAVHHER